MLTQTEHIILELIRKALDKEYEYAVDASLFTGVNWAKVIDVSMSQGVGAIAFDAVELLPQECRLDMDNLMEWLGQTSYQETQYEQNWEVACELAELWKANGISAIVLKGRAIAQYYPKSNNRYSCDLDVLIPDVVSSSCAPVGAQASKLGAKFQVSSWKRACQLLEEKGIKLEHEVYKEVEFTYKDVYVECHRYITPVRGNDNLLKFERYLRTLLECEPAVYFEGTSLVNPPLIFTMMLYIEHALGDLLHGKLTLKHVVDWMILRKKLRVERLELRDTFQNKCKEFGFDRFLSLINAMADVVEGKQELAALPATYQQVFEGMFQQQAESKSGKSWFQRRVDLFFDIIRNRKMYQHFGYCTMEHFLFNAMWTHFFRKEVEI